VGLPRDAVVEGLRSFRPDAEHNPGRMNFFSRSEVSVVVDLAHNEAGLEALLEIMNGVRRPGARLLLALGAVGDRQDEVLSSLAETGARDADVMVIAHKKKYLRGRTVEELEDLFRAAASRVGVVDVPSYPTEVAALEALVKQAEPGDVVGVMCHEDRQGVYDWLATQGFRPDTPETLRQKVRDARP
jgi:cyanophycin synthetase